MKDETSYHRQLKKLNSDFVEHEIVAAFGGTSNRRLYEENQFGRTHCVIYCITIT